MGTTFKEGSVTVDVTLDRIEIGGGFEQHSRMSYFTVKVT